MMIENMLQQVVDQVEEVCGGSMTSTNRNL